MPTYRECHVYMDVQRVDRNKEINLHNYGNTDMHTLRKETLYVHDMHTL